MVFSDLTLKPVVMIFFGLVSKLVVTVSPGLASKSVAPIFRFGPQNRHLLFGDLSLKLP
jgi:hypothetical protein